MDDKIKLSSPWVRFYREIEALFGEDPAVKVAYVEKMQIIKLYVEGEEKAEAIAQLLPPERTFGDVTVKVVVIPANLRASYMLDMFQKMRQQFRTKSRTSVNLVKTALEYLKFHIIKLR